MWSFSSWTTFLTGFRSWTISNLIFSNFHSFIYNLNNLFFTLFSCEDLFFFISMLMCWMKSRMIKIFYTKCFTFWAFSCTSMLVWLAFMYIFMFNTILWDLNFAELFARINLFIRIVFKFINITLPNCSCFFIFNCTNPFYFTIKFTLMRIFTQMIAFLILNRMFMIFKTFSIT